MRYLALLRGINVGGNKKIGMADLRDMAAALGLDDPRTLLQSGNLVFGSTMTAAKLESMLEAETMKRFGVQTHYQIRTAADWSGVIAGNPFTSEAKTDPARLVVICFRSAPVAKDVKALQSAIVGRETIRAVGRQGYAVYPDGQGESKLTLQMIEKALRTTGTARNWNTVTKIGVALGE
jgi:uncharacterized protein (DUF1697 family)